MFVEWGREIAINMNRIIVTMHDHLIYCDIFGFSENVIIKMANTIS